MRLFGCLLTTSYCGRRLTGVTDDTRAGRKPAVAVQLKHIKQLRTSESDTVASLVHARSIHS